MSNDEGDRSLREPLFSAALRPHRSLPPAGFLALMAVLGGLSFAAGMVFLLHGAWPVFGFFGLDVALVYVAFRLNYRDGRRLETVDLSREELLVRRIDPRGRVAQWRFQPYWVRLHLTEHDDTVGPLTLSSHGRRLSLGAFLSGPERRDFARALEAALAQARA